MASRERRNEDAQYIAEKRTIQILEVLKHESDNEHRLSQNQILELLKETGEPSTENIGTLSKTIDEILKAVNPDRFSENNDNEFKIKYKGYEKNLVIAKEKIKTFLKRKSENLSADEIEKLIEEVFFMFSDDEKKEFAAYKKAPPITDINYVHDFSSEELDQLMDAVNFSNHLSSDEKRNLMRKLQGTSSKYYQSPFYDLAKNQCRFNSKGIYGRYHSRDMSKDGENGTVRNIKLIQDAINKACKIKFTLNAYDEKGKLVAGQIKTADGKYMVSPYYIVVYQDLYYLIAGMTASNNASHYRIDLMTDIEIAIDKDNNIIKIDSLNLMENLPNKDAWDPKKYMCEHMYMFYGEPKKIRILLKKDHGGYTLLHDWFGGYFAVMSEKNKFLSDETKDCLEVEVSCVPEAIKIWADSFKDRVIEYLVIE